MPVLLAASLLSACGGDGSPAPTPTTAPGAVRDAAGGAFSCVPVISFRGRIYEGLQASDLRLGTQVGTATTPACDDTPGTVEQTDAAPFPVYRIAGVAPEVAVATRADPTGFWVWYDNGGELGSEIPAAVRELVEVP